MYPQVIIFACNWDGWSCIDAAANVGLHYPASVKAMRVSCLSRIHAGLILKAFEFGAEGVMLLGCEPGRCHFGTDCNRTVAEYEKARNVLQMLGIDQGRLVLSQLPAFSGYQFIEQLTNLTNEIEQTPAAGDVSVAQSSNVKSHS